MSNRLQMRHGMNKSSATIVGGDPRARVAARQPVPHREEQPARSAPRASADNTLRPVVDPLSMRLLVRMPTRSRPQQALEVLGKYRSMAGCSVLLEVVIDDDDASMHAPDVQHRLADLGCEVTSGRHRSKIEAVNDGRVGGWDVLLLASDDMVPVAQGYALRALTAMATHFPCLDGAVYFDDGYAGDKLCTLPVMGRRLYQQFGYVYQPEYKSFFCDNEQTEVLKATHRLVYVPERVIEHRHAANGKAPVDALYEHNNGPWDADRALYERRRRAVRPGAVVGFDAPAVELSICVATLPSRAKLCAELVDNLYRQIARFPRAVEVVVDGRVGVSTGIKRNAMNQRAVGLYVAHVDDDDGVSPDYVEKIVAAVASRPDCVEMRVSVAEAGGARAGHCSIRYGGWETRNGIYTRCPNHLNPVRRELALRVGFPDKTIGEDHDYSVRLRPLLQTEAPVSGTLYHYYPGRGRA